MDGIHNLPRPAGSHRDGKRLGRGPGSGTGKTAGKGHKGSKARAGHHGPGGGKPAYEGGQMPIARRLPKRGFTNLTRVAYQVVNLYQLEALDDEEITPDVLFANRLVTRTTLPIKILGSGSLTRKVTVAAHAFSESAKAGIEAAGGSVQELA